MSISTSIDGTPTMNRIALHIVAAALLLTVLNALKPIHADDPVYLRYGAEFAAHPLDPYAFDFGSPMADAANHILVVPPVFEYWLAAGTLFWGDNPTRLKLWLFPFALLLAWAVSALAGRFAPSLQTPLLWLIVVSPSILPCLNIMLDVPVLALGLSAIVLAMRALEDESWPLILLAGVVAGLAVQTKYNGIVAVAAILVLSVLWGRPFRGFVAAIIALSLVIGWECFIAAAQGESHFLIHLRQRQGQLALRCARLILPMFSHVAGLATATALLGAVALGWNRRAIAFTAFVFIAGFAALAVLPSQTALFSRADGKSTLSPSNIIYGLMAILVWSILAAVCFQFARRRVSDDRRLDWFLLLWMILEIGVYFALSPFPAARRVAGLLIVFALLAGRLASVRNIAPRFAIAAAGYGAIIALVVFVADCFDTHSGQEAARRVARIEHTPTLGGTYWYLSWMGFGYYAEREGLVPLQLNRKPPQPGDLVAIESSMESMRPTLPPMNLVLLNTIEVGDSFPLRATPGYCSGRTPLEHNSGPRTSVRIYRVAATSTRVPAMPTSQGRE